jgi:peroxiredoxin
MRILSAFLVALLLVPSFAVASSSDVGPNIGKKAPSFELNSLDGKKVGLSDYSGKVVLLNFWASWCGPCKAEMPSLNALYTELKDRDFVVLAVSIDSSEGPVRSFRTEKGLAFPILMDPEKEVYFDDYAVFALPTSFLIDADGVVREKFMGEIQWDAPAVKQRIIRHLPGGKR